MLFSVPPSDCSRSCTSFRAPILGRASALDVAVANGDAENDPPRRRASSLAMVTERWRPPVQPMATVAYDFPSRRNPWTDSRRNFSASSR